MFLVETYALAVALCLITMICWGSWPNTQKLADRSWRFELFYWDYVSGILLIVLFFACTFGSIGNEGRNFMHDIRQAAVLPLLSAMLGGVIFNAGNILFVAAIVLAGMSVAFPVGGGLALILGVMLNYLAFPLGNPWLLFAGVLLILAAMLCSATAYRRLARITGTAPARGIMLAVLAGVLFGCFYRFIGNAMAVNFADPEAGKLTPYTAVFFFSLGVFLSNILFNTILMKKPLQGAPVQYKDYLRGSIRSHAMGIAGGAIWGTGLVLSILSAGPAGFAVSFGLGQGNALIAAIWGVLIWKEFRNAPRTTGLLWMMFACYIVGLLLIIFSR